MNKYSESFPNNSEDAREARTQILSTLKKEFNKNQYEINGNNITIETEPTLLSWGEIIEISISDAEIFIKSKCMKQYIGWGRNKRNINRLCEIIPII